MTESVSYSQAIECKLNNAGCGIEGYIVRTAISLSLLATVTAVATGYLKLPTFVTRFARGPLYIKKSFLIGMGVGGGLSALGAPKLVSDISSAPVTENQRRQQRDWREESHLYRAVHVSLRLVKSAIWQVGTQAISWSLLAVTARFGLGHRFWSGLGGFLTGCALVDIPAQLLGGLITHNREVLEDQQSRTTWLNKTFKPFFNGLRFPQLIQQADS